VKVIFLQDLSNLNSQVPFPPYDRQHKGRGSKDIVLY